MYWRFIYRYVYALKPCQYQEKYDGIEITLSSKTSEVADCRAILSIQSIILILFGRLRTCTGDRDLEFWCLDSYIEGLWYTGPLSILYCRRGAARPKGTSTPVTEHVLASHIFVPTNSIILDWSDWLLTSLVTSLCPNFFHISEPGNISSVKIVLKYNINHSWRRTVLNHLWSSVGTAWLGWDINPL